MEELKAITNFPKNNELNKEIVEIDEEKQEISKFQKSAEIFGKSLFELENEFIDFKVEKLKSKIDYLLEDVFSEIGLKEKIISAKRNGFCSVTVMPTRLSSACKLLSDKKLQINTLIAYPHGEEFSKVKVLSAKISSKKQISAVLTPITPLMLNYNRIKITEKELVNIKKTIGKKKVKVIITPSEFTQNALTALIKLLIDVKIDTIIVKIENEDMLSIKKLFEACQEKICIEAMGNINLNMGIKLLNLGCKKLSVTSAEKLCDELITKLKA